jgi:putative flavoprotein involved in K+ transport
MVLTIEAAVVDKAPNLVVSEWLERFDQELCAGDAKAAAELFVTDSFWRDLVAFTWNIKTVEGRDQIRSMLDAVLAGVGPGGWRLEGVTTEQDGIVSAFITFETALGRGKGFVRLRQGLCWTLLTALAELKGCEEKRGYRRPVISKASDTPNTHAPWGEWRDAERNALGASVDPYIVIVGGGQAGLALGARLKQLDVPTLIVDSLAKSGDAWRRRYKSLRLHDPVWYDHMPYLPFPEHWPVYMARDQIGNWLESYERIMDLDVWHSTDCIGAAYDESSGRWEVNVVREGGPVSIRCTHLVLATGIFGLPSVPAIKGANSFKGTQVHSSRYSGGDAWRGKKAVVIGANTSAHDICADLWEHGADVTMVQRSSTLVVRTDAMRELVLDGLYSENSVKAGMTTEKADLLLASIPYRLLKEFSKPTWDLIRERDAAFYARLEAAGFLLDFGEDGSGLWAKFIRRGGGYYIDVGTSEMIADGRIKLKGGVGVAKIREHSVVLSKGEELPADLIVYATGYGPMNDWAAQLISLEVADKVGRCWGVGSETAKDPGPWEGESRNMWKPTGQPGLWFHGGNLHQSRDYSSYLALQLKARMESIPTPVFGQPSSGTRKS